MKDSADRYQRRDESNSLYYTPHGIAPVARAVKGAAQRSAKPVLATLSCCPECSRSGGVFDLIPEPVHHRDDFAVDLLES